MDYVTSDNLGNLVGLGIILYMRFTYAVRLIEHFTILLNLFNVPSMMYATVGPWAYAGTGMPTVTSTIAASK